MIASNKSEAIADLKKSFTSRYEMKDLGEINHYLGMRVTRSSQSIKIDQETYADDILRHFDALLHGT